MHIRVAGEASQAGGLLVCNHVSWLDIPVLGALRPLRLVAKSEVRHWPLAGWLAARIGTLFFRRGAGDLRHIGRQMAEVLEANQDLALFPEGTTTNGYDVRHFFPRLLAPALDPGRPIIPVAIRYLEPGRLSPRAPFIGDDALLPHLLRLLPAPAIEVRVRFCTPIQTRERDRSDLSRAAHLAIRQALAELPGGVPDTPPCPTSGILDRAGEPQLQRCSWT